jgi:serine/threonine-protein kinase
VAWSGSPDTNAARLLRIERAAGVLDAAGFRAARAEFVEGWTRQSSRTRFVRGVAWVVAFGGLVETKEDADEALAELSSRAPIPVGLRTAANDEALGRAYLFAGEIDRAIPPLTRASRMCLAASEPFRHVRVRLLLGDALAAKGDAAAACAAYAAVLARWGEARPRSITAERARERAKKTGCK